MKFHAKNGICLFKISENGHAILGLLKSGIVYTRNLPCNEMCSDVAMSK